MLSLNIGRLKKQIPKDWQILKVGQVCSIHNHLRSFALKRDIYKNPGIYPCYGATECIGHLDTYTCDSSKSNKFVLITQDGSNFYRAANQPQTRLIDSKCNPSNAVHIVKGSTICKTEWFFMYFLHRDITNMLIGDQQGRSHLIKRDLVNMPILIPPIEFQKRTYTIYGHYKNALDILTSIIVKKRQKLHIIKDKLFVGKVYKLKAIASILKGRKVFNTQGKHIVNLSSHSLGAYKADTDIEFNYAGRLNPYFECRIGQVLIGRYRFQDGAFGIVTPELDNFLVSNNIIQLDLDADIIKPRYFLEFIKRKSFYEKHSVIVNGTAQKYIIDLDLYNLPIAVPSLEYQSLALKHLSNLELEISLLESIRDKTHKKLKAILNTVTGL